MLRQGINAVVVGPDRKTIIMLDLDLYNRALQIQQTVGNTNWINTIQYNTRFIYIVGDTNCITLAMNSYLPTYRSLEQVFCTSCLLLFTILAKQLMVVDLIYVQLKKAYTPQQLYVDFKVAKHTREE